MYEKPSEPIRLSESERAFLKARIDCDVRTSGSIARSSGINPGAMVDAIAGNRSINSGALQSLLKTIGVDAQWHMRTDVPHFLKLSADLAQLQVILSRVLNPELWWIMPFMTPGPSLDMEHTAQKTFYAIRTDEGHLFLIDRDPWRIGKGKKSVVAPEDALPLAPGYLESLGWGGGSLIDARINLKSRDRMRLGDIFAGDAAIPEKSELMSILFQAEGDHNHAHQANWEDVIKLASASGISATEVLDAVKSLRNRKHN